MGSIAHVPLSDAAPAAGGEDCGPGPHELLDARRKGCRLEGIEAEVSHQEADGVYPMRRDIRLVGELAPGEHERLLEIANKCPVSRTLAGRFAIRSALVD